jgi:hypothetical protein
MNLVEELRNDVINSEISLSVALRKAKVLASLLEDVDFKSWVSNELNGYPEDEELPKHRIIRSENFGTFSGPFGSGAKNVGVAIWKMSDNFQKMYAETRFDAGVRELESMLEGGDGPTLMGRWPAEAVALWNMEYENASDYNLIGAQSQIAKSSVDAILDATRNKLLDFVLELQELDPKIMKSEEAISNLPKDEVHNVFNYTVYGSHNVVAGGQEVNQEVTQVVKSNDQKSLIKYFENLGIEKDDLNDLEVAIEKDGAPEENGEFGTAVKSWIGNMIVKASKGAWKIAIEAAPKLLTADLSNFYGWGP